MVAGVSGFQPHPLEQIQDSIAQKNTSSIRTQSIDRDLNGEQYIDINVTGENIFCQQLRRLTTPLA